MLSIPLPSRFSFAQCLAFLDRSEKEVLHAVQARRFIRPARIGERKALLEVSESGGQLWVRDLLSGQALPDPFAELVRELFDLDRDLEPFEARISQDPDLAPLLERYSGLRLIRIPDLFEALSWTIIGQQINLAFAYTMKARLVAAVGEQVEWQGQRYGLFPRPERVLELNMDKLKAMQFSRQKADYLLHLAGIMARGELSKEELSGLGDYASQHKRLLGLRGIGPWSADYTLLKCLGVPSAFPISDVGLHNALRTLKGTPDKPKPEQIRAWAENWAGWEGYVTFYLWRSLIPG